jgi:hypothetical protein
MNFDKTKTKTVTLIVILAFATTILSLPMASAHDPAWTIPTWSYMSVTPNLIGVGQQVLLTFWLDKVPLTAVGAYGDRWEGTTISVTTPTGNKETLGPFKSDPVGAAWTQYTPTSVGTYTFQMNFPGQTLTGEPTPPDSPRSTEYIGDYFEPSTSSVVTLTVQQDAIKSYPEAPIPEGYWERPIYGENREWWKISGNWLNDGSIVGGFNPYTTAPESAHIVWTKELALGGIAGGKYGSIPYYEGLSYENKFPTPIIMQGRLYYNDYPTYRYNVDTFPDGFSCVDLRTGETLWWQNGTVSTGQIYNYESPNAHGTLGYVWKTGDGSDRNWYMHDAFNGLPILTMENVPSGTSAVGDDGSILRYVLNTRNNWLALWNSSRAVWSYWAPYSSNQYWNWRPVYGGTVDALKDGYSWNITIPAGLEGSIAAVLDDRIIGASGGVTAGFGVYGINQYSIWALSLDPATRGQLLWKKDYSSPPTMNTSITMGPMDLEDGVFTMKVKETRQWYGYSLETGNQLWGPTDSQGDWDVYGMSGSIAYDKLFSCGYSGILYCYDIHTGELLWTYESESSGFESPYGDGRYPFSISVIADGKIYLHSSEHSPTKPYWRGSKLRCVDVNTGDELWKLPVWVNGPLIADGYLVCQNCYDNQIYCFGKGQTTTTVTAPNMGVPLGSSVMISGTVTDQSPGAKGTPAIGDEYMSEWMEYLYMQKPCPMMVNGVTVKLETLDPNGNFYEIGTVTSDASGMYKLMWEPPVPGEYTIIATFEGSDSYYSSYAEAAIGVEEAPAPSGTIEPEPTEGFAITTTELAIIAVAIIALVGIIAFWALRKRK